MRSTGIVTLNPHTGRDPSAIFIITLQMRKQMLGWVTCPHERCNQHSSPGLSEFRIA